jgi:hypothetical protein
MDSSERAIKGIAPRSYDKYEEKILKKIQNSKKRCFHIDEVYTFPIFAVSF